MNFTKIYINFNFLNSLPRYIFELFYNSVNSYCIFFLINRRKNNEEIIKILALFFAASLEQYHVFIEFFKFTKS